jgi:hypothetical protein
VTCCLPLPRHDSGLGLEMGNGLCEPCVLWQVWRRKRPVEGAGVRSAPETDHGNRDRRGEEVPTRAKRSKQVPSGMFSPPASILFAVLRSTYMSATCHAVSCNTCVGRACDSEKGETRLCEHVPFKCSGFVDYHIHLFTLLLLVVCFAVVVGGSPASGVGPGAVGRRAVCFQPVLLRHHGGPAHAQAKLVLKSDVGWRGQRLMVLVVVFATCTCWLWTIPIKLTFARARQVFVDRCSIQPSVIIFSFCKNHQIIIKNDWNMWGMMKDNHA